MTDKNNISYDKYPFHDDVKLSYFGRSDKEIDYIIRQGIDDFKNGRSFPENGNFNGLDNYSVMMEINNTVVGVRLPDLTYATWNGNTTDGVSNEHYMMTRNNALEDFAVRANIIDKQRYITNDEYSKIMIDGLIPERIRDDISKNLQDNLDSYGSDGFTFCVISYAGNGIATSMNMMDNDTFYEHIRDFFDENDWYPDGDYVDFHVTEYKYGYGKTTATDKQIEYINAHLDNVLLFSQETDHQAFEVDRQYILNLDMGEYHGR